MSKRLAVYDERNALIKAINLHGDTNKADAQTAEALCDYTDAGFKVTTNAEFPGCWLLTQGDEWRVACIEEISPRLMLTGRREVIRTKTVTELYKHLGEK